MGRWHEDRADRIAQVDIRPEQLGRRAPIHLVLVGDFLSLVQLDLPVKAGDRQVWRQSCSTLYMQDKSELELIACGRRGDQEAVGELFRRHYASSLKVARRILRNHDDSQDAVQTAYLLAFRHLVAFRENASFKTWITRIVVNCCFMRLRDPAIRVTWVHLDDPDRGRAANQLVSDLPSPEKSAWYGEIASAFSDAVGRLPRALREAYALYALSDQSLREVAETLRLTLPGAKTRIFRARAGMRSHLRRFGPAPIDRADAA
jgi:RNA polymerase sigma-70 factor (ECF subfamily)